MQALHSYDAKRIGNAYLRFAIGILVDIPRFSFLCAKINSPTLLGNEGQKTRF